MRHPGRFTLRLVAGLAGLLLVAFIAHAMHERHGQHHATHDAPVHEHASHLSP